MSDISNPVDQDERQNNVDEKGRWLGDEWRDWDGNDDEDPTAGKGLFLGLTVIAWLLAGAWAWFSWYLVVPRIEQFGGATLASVSIWIGLALGALGFIWLALLFFTVSIQKPLLGPLQVRGMHRYLPIVISVGRIFNISRDRMAHSFLKVSNAITVVNTLPPKKVLLLLPRCLTKDNQRTIRELCKATGIHVATVTGGSQARTHVEKLRPGGVIGIACERDLLAGVRDVSSKIAVLGIPNRRPHGPCYNTEVDIIEVEKAIRRMVSISSQNP